MLNNRAPQGIASLRPAFAEGGTVRWGGDKNIQGRTFDIDPAAVQKVYAQLNSQRQANPSYFRSGEKNTALPDEFLRDMASNLVASGVTDISQVGRSTVETGASPVQKAGRA
jgi:hypothetical protein